MNLTASFPRGAAPRTLLALAAALCVLALPAKASAVVPAFTLSEPTNNKRVSNQLSINGYVSNVDVQIQCNFPGNSPGSTNFDCTYMNRWVSVGLTVFGAEGSRTLTVTATAQDGSNQQTTINRTVIVDKTGPTTTINSGPSGGNSYPGTNFQWTFSANETATFWCRIDSGSWESCTSPYSANGLSDGAHSFQVRGDDEAGNNGGTATANFNVNNAPPTASFNSVFGSSWVDGVTNYVSSGNVDWYLTRSRDDALLECRLDDGVWEACSLPYISKTGLAEGTHTMDVRAFLVGPTNVQDPPTRSTIVVDTVAPVASFTGVPQHFAGTSATINWSANEELTETQCYLDGAGFSPCPTDFVGLSGGDHELELYVRDRAGNWGSDTFTFRTYPSPPDTTVTGSQAPTTAVDTATFMLSSSSGGGTFECRVDSGAWKSCSSVTSVKVGEYSGGAHVFEARAVDPAGQTDPTPASTAFTLNNPPAVPAPKPSRISGRGKTLSVSLSGPGKVSVKVETCKKIKRKTKCRRYTTGTGEADAAGSLKIKLKKKLKKGARYRVTITTTSSTGAKKSVVKTIKGK